MIDRAAESIMGAALGAIAELNTRIQAIERRLDRIADTTTALTRWADRLDGENTALTGTQAAQQRAIDDLARRVSELEKRAS
jgi:polyhydroxyalkanoate synthesis regulator phasin